MPRIDFGTNETWVWNGTFEEVHFWVYDGGRRVMCRVSQECIEDNLGNPGSPESCLDAAKAHFDTITDKVMLLIAAGRFERDGSILIRNTDW